MKPLCSDDTRNESKSIFSSSTSSGSKYKLSEESQKKIKDSEKSGNQVPKANEAFCMDMYKNSTVTSLSTKKVDLFSGLNQTVKVSKLKLKANGHTESFFCVNFQSIDFNSTSASDSSQVTIHKRNRGSDENISPSNSFESPPSTEFDNNMPKKKKYKIVPNSSVTSPPPQAYQSTSNTNLSTTNRPMSAAASTVTSKATTSAASSLTSDTGELPKDRKDLLKFVSYFDLFEIF